MQINKYFGLIAKKILILSIKYHIKLWKNFNPDFNARHWSNFELKKYAAIFNGHVVNISAGDDKDKEGSHYKDYFTNAKSYSTTNYKKINDNSDQDELLLDLSNPNIESSLSKKYDVVFTHTVLEHIFDIEIAIKNLCYISNDIIISIVPFIQAMHQNEDVYHDYWRFSPYSMTRLFQKYGFQTLYINWNNDPFGNVYIIHIASIDFKKWHSNFDNTISNMGPGYIRQTIFNETTSCQNGLINNPTSL